MKSGSSSRLRPRHLLRRRHHRRRRPSERAPAAIVRSRAMRRKTIVRLGAHAGSGGVAARRLRHGGGAREAVARAGRESHQGQRRGFHRRAICLRARARVRLSAIDTPEYDQPYGDRSSAALKAMLPIGSTVELEVETQDSFNRIVATVWLVANGNRTNLNEAMLRDGHAWAYRRYMKDPQVLRSRAGSARTQGGPVGAAGERLGVSTGVALPQGRRDPRAAHAVRGDARDTASPCSPGRQGHLPTAEVMGTFLFSAADK